MKQRNHHVDSTATTGRRTLIRALGVTALAGLAGCLGDAGDDGPGDDAGDDTAATTADTTETADDSGTTDDAPALRPSDLGLSPSDAWDDDHPAVEVPTEPGHAVLVVDGQRVEMVGDLSGGPRDALYETVSADDEFLGDGAYFLADGLYEPTEAALAEHGWDTGHQVRFLRRMVGWAGNSLRYVHSDSFTIGWPNLIEAATYSFREEPDGSIATGGLVGTTAAQAPFLRIDATGVITATGTIEDPGGSDVPDDATFEFGARAQDGWAEQWG